eukprot:8426714-Karenia_brevis.AAC.1
MPLASYPGTGLSRGAREADEGRPTHGQPTTASGAETEKKVRMCSVGGARLGGGVEHWNGIDERGVPLQDSLGVLA